MPLLRGRSDRPGLLGGRDRRDDRRDDRGDRRDDRGDRRDDRQDRRRRGPGLLR
jgi:16S rRNA (cytosine967-C5)-methyltransferase